MFDERLKIAYEKSDEVLEALLRMRNNELNVDNVSTQEIVDIVEDKVDCRIRVSTCSFADIANELKDYGAMMWTELQSAGTRIANIVLNSDHSLKFQRFSLVHELGHLMTADNVDNLFVEEERYIVSTHIDYSVTNISPESYRNNEFLLGEQRANIFALRVLMPTDDFYKRIEKYDSLREVANSFGLSRDAVLSRIMLVK